MTKHINTVVLHWNNIKVRVEHYYELFKTEKHTLTVCCDSSLTLVTSLITDLLSSSGSVVGDAKWVAMGDNVGLLSSLTFDWSVVLTDASYAEIDGDDFSVSTEIIGESAETKLTEIASIGEHERSEMPRDTFSGSTEKKNQHESMHHEIQL